MVSSKILLNKLVPSLSGYRFLLYTWDVSALVTGVIRQLSDSMRQFSLRKSRVSVLKYRNNWKAPQRILDWTRYAENIAYLVQSAIHFQKPCWPAWVYCQVTLALSFPSLFCLALNGIAYLVQSKNTFFTS